MRFARETMHGKNDPYTYFAAVLLFSLGINMLKDRVDLACSYVPKSALRNVIVFGVRM